MSVRQRCIRALFVFAVSVAFTPAQASLILTQAGIDAGFTLSNFLSGGSGYTFLGSANLPDGTIAVGGFAGGQIFKFSDTDNQTIGNALSSVSFPGHIDMATAGGQAYAASRTQGYFRVANDLTLTQITTVPPTLPTQGLAGNPVTGHLISVSSGNRLIDLNPATGAVTFIVTPPNLPDGVSVSPDGTIAYVAIFGGAAVRGYNILTGAEVFTATGLPGGPDGTAVIIGGDFDGDIVVNNNDGTVGLLDVSTGIETIIASGGTRGDFASPNLNDGSLFIYESDSAWRLKLRGAVIGPPPPEATVPEPSTLPLLALGLGAVMYGMIRRRKRS